MARYLRNSALRARGINPTRIMALRAENRRLSATADIYLTGLNTAATAGARYLIALDEIKRTTGPVVERARERGTDASGTIRKIDRLASDGIGL